MTHYEHLRRHQKLVINKPWGIKKVPKPKVKTYKDYVREYNEKHKDKPINLKLINWGGGK